MNAKQLELPEGKSQIRVNINTRVIRMAKSKAAMDDQTLSSVVESLLRQYINGKREVE